ncbi:hypothetical protein ACFTWD_08360 [Streptomyces sp. NPDC056943]|uniref:hypothetical protein n=1 Tax=Streptomyces sp. NPDC056943 TaxID=3345971 RepID=UPI0036368947
MRGTRWAAVAAGAGAAAVTLLGAGSGDGGAGAGASGFGREAAQAEIFAAVASAGLPKTELPAPGAPEPTGSAPVPAPSTEAQRLERRATECGAGWQYIGSPVAEARGKYDATVTGLVREGWTAGKRQDRTLDENGGTTAGVTLKKSGWTMMARHHTSMTVKMDVLSFYATEDACMAQFSEREMKLLMGD